MASIDIEVAGRRYNVSCRDGEEDHLRGLAAAVDRRARDAGAAVGALTETRQLLFAALLLADDAHGPQPAEPAADLAESILALAERIDAIAARLEKAGAAS